LVEGFASGQSVYFLRIEAAETHPQYFFDGAQGAPEDVIGFRGLEDVDLRFGISLWERPRGIVGSA
jgi:hypothetical protein